MRLDAWRGSSRCAELRELLKGCDGVDPDDVIIPPAIARQRGMTSTIVLLNGKYLPRRFGDQSHQH